MPDDAVLANPLAGRSIGRPDGPFVAVEWTAEGSETSRSFPIAPPHIHNSDDELWYVLKGKLGFTIGEQEIEAGSGSAVLAPRGVPHSYWNPGSERARYLLIVPPNILRLVEALHSPAMDGPQDYKQIFRRHDSELL